MCEVCAYSVYSVYSVCVYVCVYVCGYLFNVNNAPITWRSGRQIIVTTSTTESEYVAAYDGSKETVWLRKLFEELGCEMIQLVDFLVNLQSANAESI
jgi:5-methylcytosine-specific restriction endonuclease McrA